MHKANFGKWLKRGGWIAVTMTTVVMTGCGGGGGGESSSGSNKTSGNSVPTIGASPSTQASVGSTYSFAPDAKDADGDALAFSIQNKPNWADFNTATGHLSGTPSAQSAAENIVISVSDGKATASLPAFTITVAAAGSTPASPSSGVELAGPNSVALSWAVPTRTIDGQPLTDLTGYRIHYGTNENALVRSVEVTGSGSNRFTVSNLGRGTYYFAVRAVTSSGAESQLSNVITRVVG